MAANPRMLNKDVTITWDGVATTIQRGTIVDVPAGSSLESAYGSSNLVSLDAQQTGGSEDTGAEDDEGGEG